MIETRGQLKAGEKVLILGASGGVGTCCVQLAKSLGCEVIACASSAWKVAKLKELGADHVIDTSAQNYVAEIHRLYGKPRTRGGGGVDVIVNYTGGETWAECFRALKLQGKLLTCGATAGYDPKRTSATFGRSNSTSSARMAGRLRIFASCCGVSKTAA